MYRLQSGTKVHGDFLKYIIKHWFPMTWLDAVWLSYSSIHYFLICCSLSLLNSVMGWRWQTKVFQRKLPFAATAQTQTTVSLSHLLHTSPPFSHRPIFLNRNCNPSFKRKGHNFHCCRHSLSVVEVQVLHRERLKGFSYFQEVATCRFSTPCFLWSIVPLWRGYSKGLSRRDAEVNGNLKGE